MNNSMKEAKDNKGFIENVFESVMTPGVTPFIEKTLHATFICLLLVLTIVFVITDRARIHIAFLFILALLLYVSIYWFISIQKTHPPSESHPSKSKKQQ